MVAMLTLLGRNPFRMNGAWLCLLKRKALDRVNTFLAIPRSFVYSAAVDWVAATCRALFWAQGISQWLSRQTRPLPYNMVRKTLQKMINRNRDTEAKEYDALGIYKGDPKERGGRTKGFLEDVMFKPASAQERSRKPAEKGGRTGHSGEGAAGVGAGKE